MKWKIDTCLNLSVFFLLSWIFDGHAINYPAVSTTYYVDAVKGDDNNAGDSPSNPLKTIQRAINLTNEGDTVLINGGTYREHVTIKNRDNLTIRRRNNQAVIITGLDVLGKGVRRKDNYAFYFRPEDKEQKYDWHLKEQGMLFSQLFINNTWTAPAAFPDISDLLEWNSHGSALTIYSNGKVDFDNQLLSSYASEVGGIFHAVVERKWNAVQGKVKGVKNGSLFCEALSEGWAKSAEGIYNKNIFSYEGHEYSGVGRGFVIHDQNYLDSEGEWFYDKMKDSLYVRSTADLSRSVLEARSRKYGLTIDNGNKISIEGIDFRAAGILVINADHVVIADADITYSTPFYKHVNEFNGKSMIRVEGGNTVIIKDSYIGQSWGSGLEIKGGANHIIQNCLIEDVNWMGTYNGCIRARGDNITIRENTLRKSGRFLIHDIGLKRSLITLNHMYNGMNIGQDGGAYYTHVNNGMGTEISYNWIHDIYGIPWERSTYPDHNISVGIYLDGGCRNYSLHHKRIWGTKYGIMLNASRKQNKTNTCENNSIKSNTIVNTDVSIVSKNIPELYRNNVIENNLVNSKIGALGAQNNNFLDADNQIISQFFQVKSGRTELREDWKVNSKFGAYPNNLEKWIPGALNVKSK